MSEHYTFTADMTATVGAATKKTDYDKVAANTDEINERFNDHSALHENGGADEISVAGLSGELADDQPPKAHYLDSHAAEAGHDGNFIRSNADSSALEWYTPAQAAGTMRLNKFAAPDGTVDFDLQQANDLVVMTVADEAALPTADIALGQLCWATGELSLHICSAIA